MIEAFIFDIGNVLLRFDFQVAVRRIEGKCNPLTEAAMKSLEPLQHAYESGKLARAEFQEKLKSAIGYTGSDADLVSAWEEIFTENMPMIRLAEELHGKYPIFLLSNTNDLHVDYIFRTYPAFALFSDAVYSYRAGHMKPNKEIFEIAIRQFGVQPEKTIYIDDLEANIAGARAAGLVAIRYDFARHDEFEENLKRVFVNTH